MAKAKHAFGALENIDSAISSGKVDAYDILFVKDADGKPYVGWVDKDGNKVVVDDSEELAKLEASIETKANADDVEAELKLKADVEDVEEKLEKVAQDSVATAKAYTDGKVEAAVKEHLVKKYEVTDTPDGTLVNVREGEIRIMCPEDSVFTKQSVGAGGDPNSYYCTLKTYVFDDNIVGYREHLGSQVDEEILKDLKTDEFGHRYQPSWLALAKYDEATGVWNYYGKNSSKDRMIGWDYRIDWYDANGVIIASDSIRINLANENCYFTNEPYYVGGIKKEIDTIIEEKLSEVESSWEIVEF